MPITIYQWFGIVSADFIARALYFLAITFNPFTVFISLVVSSLSIAILLVVSGLVHLFGPRGRSAGIAILILTSVVFAVAFVVLWVSFIKSGQQTACVGYKQECDWIEGTIQPLGVYTIATQATMQVAISMAPLLFLLFGRQRAAQERDPGPP